MIVIEKILGNIKREARWQQRLENASVDILSLSQWEAQKSRCRKTTRGGQDLGISLERHQTLSDGDVLLWDKTLHRAVIVEMSLRDVMIIDLRSLLDADVSTALRMGFNVGHALGNQHWKAVIKDSRIFLPLTVAAPVMESVMNTHGFQNLSWSFVKGESILPSLTQAEARLLFGGAEDAGLHIHVDSHR